MPYKYFISHLSCDEDIAKAFRNQLEKWNISRQEIHLSSAAESGPMIGTELNPSLAKAIRESKILFLFYTYENKVWDYVMWEAGVATNPSDDVITRVVVFKCTADNPKVFNSNMVVPVTLKDIEKFTTQFHKNSKFIPGEPPFLKDISDEILKERAQNLYTALTKNIPQGIKEPAVERPRWPYLKLHINKESTDSIHAIKLSNDAEKMVPDILLKNATIKEQEEALTHFSVSALTPDIGLRKLTDEWGWAIENKTGKTPDNNWLKGLSLGIWRGIRNTTPMPISRAPLQSTSDEFWYHMLVTSITDLPNGASEVSILMLREAAPEEQK